MIGEHGWLVTDREPYRKRQVEALAEDQLKAKLANTLVA
jgi:hypothetical protein